VTNLERSLAQAVVAAVLVLVGVGITVSDDDVSSHPMIGEPAPGFNLEKVGGGKLSLEDLKGKYIVLHFGASW